MSPNTKCEVHISVDIAEVKQGGTFEWELRHLLTLNFIARREGKGIRTLFRAGKCNLKDHLLITDRGQEYLAVLEASKGSDASLKLKSEHADD
jgi:hypothetical protein